MKLDNQVGVKLILCMATTHSVESSLVLSSVQTTSVSQEDVVFSKMQNFRLQEGRLRLVIPSKYKTH